jgi:hypothetical protein
MKNFKRNREPKYTINDFLIQNVEYLQDLYNEKYPEHFSHDGTQFEKLHYMDWEMEEATEIMVNLYIIRIL